MKMEVSNEVYPSRPEQIAGMAEPGPEGPIVMVNLLKFREKARYPDGRDADLSGRDAYMRYAVKVAELLPKHGGRMIYMGDVSFLPLGQCDPLWDEVALVEYPARKNLFEMSTSDPWREAAVHREAGLAGQLNIETVPPQRKPVDAPVR